MKRIFKLVEKYFFIIILLAVGISLLYPNSFAWVLSEYSGINIINLLLSIVLFTMGTTLKVDDFINVFKNPKEIAAGISAQYIIMPLIAFCLASAFSLDTALTVGIILVGTVPGGTASDVITFLAKGDVALSVSLTAVSTVDCADRHRFNLELQIPGFLRKAERLSACNIINGSLSDCCGSDRCQQAGNFNLIHDYYCCDCPSIFHCDGTWICNRPPGGNGQKTNHYCSHRTGVSKFRPVNKPCKDPFSKLVPGNCARSALFSLAEFCGINSCLHIQKISLTDKNILK